ncbi:ATP-binding cassette domain-containing protein [Peribacillus muralis]|uniref:ATP-binding cassette domain-containing protein n=1 Tax=Peribacillus muralis TaxID=264697 RepID=UPI00070F2E96|nr:ATP-binding cassette domain-containing protein [Peribacillus muralis]
MSRDFCNERTLPTMKMKKKTLLHDINYEFNSGKIYGLYGRNGFGKTMVLRVITGLIMPSSGEIAMYEIILHKDIYFPANISVIIENTALLHQYVAYINLKILAKIKNIATATDEDIKLNIEGSLRKDSCFYDGTI